MSFILGMLQGYLNADAEIMQDQRQYEQEQAEKKRLAKIESDKATLAFNRELIKKNLSQQDTYSKIYFEGIKDGKLKYNDSFEKIIAFNKERAALGLPTLSVSKFLTPFEDAEKFNSVFGNIKFRNKSNGDANDATAYLAELSAFAQTDDFAKRLGNLRITNKPKYLEFMSTVDRNIVTINNDYFQSDNTGTTTFDTNIFPGLKKIQSFGKGINVPQKVIEEENAIKAISNYKNKNNTDNTSQFFIVSSNPAQVGTSKIEGFNFETKAEQDSANKIGRLINSNVNPMHDFITYHIGMQPDLKSEDKKNIFFASVNMDQTIPDIQGLDPDVSLFSVTGENADTIFKKIQKAGSRRVKFGILALSPFMKGPTKAKVVTAAGVRKVLAPVSKQDYLVSKVFNVEVEDIGKNENITFKAIEEHKNNNQDVIDIFNDLEQKVNAQPDTPAIYTLFKQKFKAFVSLEEGILGGIVKDFLGQEGVKNIADNSSADINNKNELTSGYVQLMEDRLSKIQGTQARQIEALKISLAFKMAKADDPSGRLSNQDVEAQYVKLGKITDLKRDALAVIAQTKAQFQKKLDKYSLLIQYGKGADEATERDYKIIDAVFAYDHLRKESERYNSFKNLKPEDTQVVTLDVGSMYPKELVSKNPSNAFQYVDPNDEMAVPQSVFLAKDKDGKAVKSNNKFVYTLNDGMIVDNNALTKK